MLAVRHTHAQAVVAFNVRNETFMCAIYDHLSWPPSPAGFTLDSTPAFQAPSGSRYEWLGAAITNSSATRLATTSGGWYNMGQAAAPGTWCFTVHEPCAAIPAGCPPTGPPTTTTCGPNAQTAPLVLGGADGSTPYADGRCVCSSGAYLKPISNIKTQGCTPVAECRSGAACPGVNVLCDWQSGSNACVCKPGWSVAAGENVYVQGCSVDINECIDTSNCVKPNTVCANTPGDYSCTCKPGFVLRPGDDTRLHGCVLPSEASVWGASLHAPVYVCLPAWQPAAHCTYVAVCMWLTLLGCCHCMLCAVRAACTTPPTQPIARGAWSCSSGAATLQSGDSCAAACSSGFIGAPKLACTSDGVFAALPSEQCRYNNSELGACDSPGVCGRGCAACASASAACAGMLLDAWHPCALFGLAGGALQELFVVVQGPLRGFPPLSDDTLAMLAEQITAGLELPAPYSSGSLVTWFESATLSTDAGSEQVLRAVVGYVVVPNAALPLQAEALAAKAANPATVVDIADALQAASGSVTDPSSVLTIAASDATGKPLGTPVPVAGEAGVAAAGANCCRRIVT